jgi:hypothetical protein
MKYSLFTYEMKLREEGRLLEWSLIQNDFKLKFRPLDLKKVTLNNDSFLLLSGDDKRLHSYLLETDGSIKRKPTNLCHSVRSHWETRLQSSSSESLALKLLIQEWPGGSQGIIGHANGLFFWDLFPAAKKLKLHLKKKFKDRYVMESTDMSSKSWLDYSDDQQVSKKSEVPVPKSPIPKYQQMAHNFMNYANPSTKKLPLFIGNFSFEVDNRNFFHSGYDEGVDPISIVSIGIADTAPSVILRHPTTTIGPSGENISAIHSIVSPNISAKSSPPPPPPKSAQRAILFDGSVSCMCFYEHRHLYNRGSNDLNTRDSSIDMTYSRENSFDVKPISTIDLLNLQAEKSEEIDDDFKSYVLLGTSSGIALVCAVECLNCSRTYDRINVRQNDADNTKDYSANTLNSFWIGSGCPLCHVTLPINAGHGGIQAIATGDVNKNGYNDVVVLNKLYASSISDIKYFSVYGL